MLLKRLERGRLVKRLGVLLPLLERGTLLPRLSCCSRSGSVRPAPPRLLSARATSRLTAAVSSTLPGIGRALSLELNDDPLDRRVILQADPPRLVLRNV